MGEIIFYVCVGVVGAALSLSFIGYIAFEINLNFCCKKSAFGKKVYITDIKGKRLIYTCFKVRIRKNKIYLYPNKYIKDLKKSNSI